MVWRVFGFDFQIVFGLASGEKGRIFSIIWAALKNDLLEDELMDEVGAFFIMFTPYSSS